jgi:hypothetical protein
MELPAPGSENVGLPRIFVSYRRDDTLGFVEALDDCLRQDLGSRNVFRDLHDIHAGDRFAERVVEEIAHSDAMIAVIGPAWVGQRNGETDRIQDNADLVREEIRTALANHEHVALIPLLVGIDDVPKNLPADIESLGGLHHIQISSVELQHRTSPSYQKLLVDIWVAKRRSVPNGVLVFGGNSPRAIAQLDRLVAEMEDNKRMDVRVVSRFASGARVLSVRKARGLAKKFPEVIVLLDQDSSDSGVLAARVQALSEHRFAKTAVFTAGMALAYAAGSVTATGGSSVITADLGKALSSLGKARLVTEPAKLAYWPVSTAAKVGAACAIPLIVIGSVASHGPESPTIALTVDNWQIIEGSVVPTAAHPEPGLMKVTIDPSNCNQDVCAATFYYAAGSAGPAVLTRTNTGWHADKPEVYGCRDPKTNAILVSAATEGTASYDFQPSGEPGTFAVSYSYQGSPTQEINRCPSTSSVAVAVKGNATAVLAQATS